MSTGFCRLPVIGKMLTGGEYAGLCFDEGIYGTRTACGPELPRMIFDCGAGKIDFITMKHVNRSARNIFFSMLLYSQ